MHHRNKIPLKMSQVEINDNNKRIAKNTLYLYLRMGITMFVGLFTSRVTLNALGVHDYGVQNVVGGVVSMMTYFSGLLSSGTSRFLTVELGRNNIEQLKKTFSACLSIHLIMAILVLIAGETIGLWLLNNKLVIESDRMLAANCVYQFSLISTFLGIMQAPYGASVISHEKMSIFAYMSIYEVTAKLLAVVLLLYIDTDKLILLSAFYFIVGLSNLIFYRIYCIRKFEECALRLSWDKKLYIDIWNYVGWNVIGSFAFMMNGQGITILLNMFFGPAVNAARGIAFTVGAYIRNFVQNFQMAVGPQVIKYYAQGKYNEMNRLVCNNAKYSSFLVLFWGLPVFIETDYIIHLWLGQVPAYVVPFVRLTLIEMMVGAIDHPIGGGIHAFGKMKLPNLTASVVYLSILPITYLFLRNGASPITAYVVAIFVNPCALVCDLWVFHKYSGFDVQNYLKDVPARILFVTICSAAIPLFIHYNMEYGILRFVIVSVVSFFIAALCIGYIGLTPSMRHKITTKIAQKVINTKKMVHHS